MVEIICYHTCKNEGGKEFILNNAPFYSDNKPKNGKKGKPQWLSEGFYLWTDSDYYAKTWLKENFAIIQFTLTIDKDDLLDLVGNVNDQLEFKDYVDLYREILSKEIAKESNPKRKLQLTYKLKHITVSAVVHKLKKYEAFRYKAVKAQDTVAHETEEMQFTEQTKSEKLFYPTRQQIVIFKEGRDLLTNPIWHYPN